MSEKLEDTTALRFQRTALADVCETLAGRHDVGIMRYGGDEKTPISLEIGGMPLHLGLTLIAKQAKSRWVVDQGMILVGPWPDIWGVKLRGFRRAQRLIGAVDVVLAALDEKTHIDFIETPLSDVCDFLSDFHGMTIKLAPGNLGRTTLTARASNVTLAWALDVLLEPLKLSWACGEHLIDSSKPDHVKAFRRVHLTLADRRDSYPKGLADALQRDTKGEVLDERLADVLKHLQLVSKTQFTRDSNDKELRNLNIAIDVILPLDCLLDLLPMENGFRWRVLNGSIHVSRK